MTVNPVDMQVILPQTGQVNKIHRGLQFQQQVEQQILGQQIQQDMRNKENTVKQLSHVENNRINENPQNKKRKEKQAPTRKKTDSSLESETKTKEQEVTSKNKQVGGLLDISV